MKPILYLTFCFCFLINLRAFSQQTFGNALDSTTFTFSTTDSIIHYLPSIYISEDPVAITIDTTASILWQIGNTYKAGFVANSIVSRGIMTDTLNSYPSNTNDGFILRISAFITNPEITIWHEYQTDSLHAGGIIEFSNDSGTSWVNIADCFSVNEYNIYAAADTLISGQPAFTGTSSGQQMSSFQFVNCVAIKSTSTSCNFFETENTFTNFMIRFRFVSDSTADSLAGWKIDSIKISTHDCGSGITPVQAKQLNVLPIPAYNGIFHFPDLQDENHYRTEIFDMLSNKILTTSYSKIIDISNYPKGIYFYKVSSNGYYYSGKLLSQ